MPNILENVDHNTFKTLTRLLVAHVPISFAFVEYNHLLHQSPLDTSILTELILKSYVFSLLFMALPLCGSVFSSFMSLNSGRLCPEHEHAHHAQQHSSPSYQSPLFTIFMLNLFFF